MQMEIRTMVKNFTLLDWMIHFGVLMNMLVTIYLVWYAIVK